MQASPPSHYQTGAILVVALMFLFIVTLLGISSLRTNFFNEKMTLVSVQREHALEAAEIALLEGEALVKANAKSIIASLITSSGGSRVPTTDAKTCSVRFADAGGLCVPKEYSDDPADHYENWIEIDGDSNSLGVWSNENRHRKVDDLIKNKYQLSVSPSYIVEFMGYVIDPSEEVSLCGALLKDGSPNVNADPAQLSAWPYCDQDNAQFRITAMARTGNYGETRVFLQTTYVVDL